MNVDLLRVIACLFVIGAHICDLPADNLSGILWRMIFVDGVSCFLIIAGFFMFRHSFRRTLVRSLKCVFLPGILALLFVESYIPLYHGESLWYCIRRIPGEVLPVLGNSLVHFMVVDDITGYLWYIFTYMMIVLALPLLLPLCRKETPAKYRLYVIALTFLYILLTEVYEIHLVPMEPGITKLLPSSFLWAVTGYEIFSRKEQIEGNRAVRIIFLIAFPLILVAGSFVQFWLHLTQGGSYFVQWNRSFAYLSAIALILFILSIPSERLWKPFALLALAGPRTLVIYLVHAPFTTLLNHFGFNKWVRSVIGAGGTLFLYQEILYLVIKIAVVFAGSLTIAVVLHYVGVCLKKLFLAFRKGMGYT